MLLEVTIHKKIEILDDIYPEWDQLKNGFHDITPFQEKSWIKNWWNFKKKRENISPYIIEIKKENKLTGLITLYTYNKVFLNVKYRILKPIGEGNSDYLNPILSKEYSPKKLINIAMKTIIRDKKNWDCIEWDGIQKYSHFDNILSNLLKLDFLLLERKVSDICPFLKLDQGFDEVKPKIDQQLLGQTLSKERRIQKKGQLTFSKVTKEDEIEPVMRVLFDLHRIRWGNEKSAISFNFEEDKEYMLKVANHLYRTNSLHLTYLKHKNKIVSIHFGMSDGNNLYFYMPAYNIEYNKYSVGSILMYYLIQLSCREGYENFDFMKGNEHYKKLWGGAEKYNIKYTIYNYSIRSLLYKLINKTYLNEHFYEKSIMKRVTIKVFVRTITVILRIYNR